MKLAELKQRVYECWARLSTYNCAVVQTENFKPEVRHFGDLRCKETWEKALAQFRALNAYDSCLDAYKLILYSFNFVPDHPEYEYRHQIFEAFLTLPDGLDLIRTGLEQLYSNDFTPEEREGANGFLRLVQEEYYWQPTAAKSAN